MVETWLKDNVQDVRIEKLLDGLVIYETSVGLNTVRSFPIFSNSFVLLKKFEETSLPSFDFSLNKEITRGYRTFRVIISKENQITGIDKNKLGKYEKYIHQGSGLSVDRTSPDTEIWITFRREGLNLIGFRITKNPNLEKVLHKGELRPQLAYILNYISEPDKNDIFLDPFAGYGAITKSRLEHFPAKEIIASDKDESLFLNLKQILKSERVEHWDALALDELKSNSIDRIVTDPPWGIFIKTENIEDFYVKMLEEFGRVIRFEGILVILTAQKELFDKLLKNSTKFSQIEKWDILVSGKKSSIYKLKKI